MSQDGQLGFLVIERGEVDVRLTPLAAEVFAVERYKILHVRLTGKALEMPCRDEFSPRRFARE